MTCSNGHEVPAGAAYCPHCGSAATALRTPERPEIPIEASEAAEPHDGDPSEQGSLAQRVRVWWSDAPRDEKIRNAILGSVVGAVVIAVIIATAVSGSDGSTSPTTDVSPSSSSTTATPPMFDPNASRAAVIASIKSVFCTSQITVVPGDVGGSTLLYCLGPGPRVSNGLLNRDGADSGSFFVFPGPDALQAALNAGALGCPSNNMIPILGPTWAATLNSPDDAAQLVQMGAKSGSCDSGSGGGQSDNGGIPNCPDGSLATPNGNGPAWLCDDGSTIP